MRQRSTSDRLWKGAEGSMAVVCAVAMVVLLGLGSLAMDVGQISNERSELQNTSDASAMAAARALIVEDVVNRVITRDSSAAVTAATTAIKTEAANRGFIWDPNGYDITIKFANWADHATGGGTWTEIPLGSVNASNANAVEITLKRASTKNYGPVTNTLGGIVGSNITEVTTSARAYMGYTYSVYSATVQIPLALPEIGPNSPIIASNQRPGWWEQVFGPAEALADAPKALKFQDNGGTNTLPGLQSSDSFNLDAQQPYLFTCGSGDSVPQTIYDILDRIPNPTHSGSINYVASLKLGDQIYARSEFCWGAGYIGPIFQRLQTAYNAKKDGSGRWRVTLPVYGLHRNPLKPSWTSLGTGIGSLARLLTPWPSEAQACYTMKPPNIYVNGFANVDITGVAYNPSCQSCGSSGGGSYTGYSNPKDCMQRNSSSCWNTNYVTMQAVPVNSTIIPGSASGTSYGNVGGQGGGLSNKEMNASALPDTGAFATIPKLIK